MRKLTQTPISLKLLISRDEIRVNQCSEVDSVQTSNLIREAIILLELPVKWIPLDTNAFGVACLFDSYNRTN